MCVCECVREIARVVRRTCSCVSVYVRESMCQGERVCVCVCVCVCVERRAQLNVVPALDALLCVCVSV